MQIKNNVLSLHHFKQKKINFKTMYREVIDKQIASAMKNGEHIKLTVWRSIKTEFVKFKTTGKNVELTDEKEMQIIRKMAQQRKDSIEQYLKAGRETLAAAEEQELNILQGLLPNEPTEDEVNEVIKSFVESKNGSVTIKDLQSVMVAVKAKYPTVNGGVVANIFKKNIL